MRGGAAAIGKQSLGLQLDSFVGNISTTLLWGVVLSLLLSGSMTQLVRKIIGRYGLPLVIAMPVSWLPLVADYARLGKSGKGALSGTWIGYAVANIWCYALVLPMHGLEPFLLILSSAFCATVWRDSGTSGIWLCWFFHAIGEGGLFRRSHLDRGYWRVPGPDQQGATVGGYLTYVVVHGCVGGCYAQAGVGFWVSGLTGGWLHLFVTRRFQQWAGSGSTPFQSGRPIPDIRKCHCVTAACA